MLNRWVFISILSLENFLLAHVIASKRTLIGYERVNLFFKRLL